eukprot:2362170-Rhodomonas_salina.1
MKFDWAALTLLRLPRHHPPLLSGQFLPLPLLPLVLFFLPSSSSSFAPHLPHLPPPPQQLLVSLSPRCLLPLPPPPLPGDPPRAASPTLGG